jgi:hypothetical protein
VYRRPALAKIVWIVGALLATGCPRHVPRPAALASAESLFERLAAHRQAVTSLRARARLRSGLSGLWVREAVLVRRPDQVRIDVLSPFGLALALGVQGALLWAYPPAEATLYEGTATPENMNRFLGAPVAVPDIVDVLLGGPPARRPVGPLALAWTDEGEYRLVVPIAGGEQRVWFSGRTLAVLRAEEGRGDEVALRIAFDDYDDDGFPRSIEVEVPPSGANARLRFDDVEPNLAIDPALFAPPPAPRVLPLDAAAPPAP